MTLYCGIDLHSNNSYLVVLDELTYLASFLSELGERTGGRVLGLFTNAEDLRRVGARLEGFFRARGIPVVLGGIEASLPGGQPAPHAHHRAPAA